MAGLPVRRISWNISPIRGMDGSFSLYMTLCCYIVLKWIYVPFIQGKTIISSLLAPLMRFRQACSIHTHSSILSSSELSSAVETNVIRPDDGGKVSFYFNRNSCLQISI